MRNSAIVAILLAAAALAGCGSPLKERFYTLSSGAAPERVDAAAAAYSVAVGAVTVPEVVDRPQMVLRVTANQVMITEQARWAEPLKSEIPRVIAGNLARLLNARVSAYPQSADPDVDYRVTVEVQRFDSALGDAVTVEALWTVRPAKGAAKSGRAVVREPAGGGDYDALVVAHGRALTAVSRDIADAIRAFGAAPR